jgi:hypothetical protein
MGKMSDYKGEIQDGRIAQIKGECHAQGNHRAVGRRDSDRGVQ